MSVKTGGFAAQAEVENFKKESMLAADEAMNEYVNALITPLPRWAISYAREK